MSSTPLTSPDMFSIGNRWTVRGFDGERTLTASHGWYIRNDIAWSTRYRGKSFIWGRITAKSAARAVKRWWANTSPGAWQGCVASTTAPATTCSPVFL